MILQLIMDLGMSICMFVLLTSPATGMRIHEYVGAMMTILFVLHLIRNRRWWKALPKGRRTGYRLMWTIADLLLCVLMALLVITGISMARYVLPRHLLPIPRQTASAIHLVAGYLGFLVMSFHVGLHLQKFYRKIFSSKPLTVLAAALCAAGVWSFVHNHFGLYITGGSHFVFIDESTPAALYEAELFLVAFLSATMANRLQGLLLRNRGNSRKEKQ